MSKFSPATAVKTWPGPGFWVPGFPISAWNDSHIGLDLLKRSYRNLVLDKEVVLGRCVTCRECA